MATKTQAEVIKEIRSKLRELGRESTWLDEELCRYINDGTDDVCRRTECLRASEVFSVSNGVQSFTGPDDAVRLHTAEWKTTGDTSVYPLDYVDYKSAQAMLHTSIKQTTGRPGLFWTWGYPPSLTIYLYPIPATAGQCTITYYRLPVRLADDNSDASSSLDIPQGWEDCVVDFAVYQALLRDRDPRWEQYKNFYEQHLTAMADATARYIDEGGMITEGINYVPNWLWDANYPY